jgi:hypothetical protein
MSHPRERYYEGIFTVAAVYDIVLGIIFLFFADGHSKFWTSPTSTRRRDSCRSSGRSYWCSEWATT